MNVYGKLISCAAVVLAHVVLAQAQTNHPAAIPMAPATAIEAPLTSVSEVIDELRSVSYRRADGERSFAVVAEDFGKYFPAAVSETSAGPAIETSAMAAVLLSLVKEAHEANEHLGSQIEHVLSDKAELERRLHSLEAEVAQLRTSTDHRLATRSRSRRRSAATARQ